MPLREDLEIVKQHLGFDQDLAVRLAEHHVELAEDDAVPIKVVVDEIIYETLLFSMNNGGSTKLRLIVNPLEEKSR